jgi:signal transduction histidine kinase
VDFFLTAVTVLGMVALAADLVERRRRAARAGRRPWRWSAGTVAPFALSQLGAAAASAALVRLYQRELADALANTSLDVLHFSLHPLELRRLALAVGLIAAHAAIVWAVVLILRTAGRHSRASHRDAAVVALVAACWAGGVLAVVLLADPSAAPVAPFVWAGATAMLITLVIERRRARYRHASQGLRLVVGALALIVPAIGMYPTVLRVATRTTRQLVETQFGPEALRQRERVQERVLASSTQVDQLPGLADLANAQGGASSRAAYAIWSSTDLAVSLQTSSVELYGRDGSVVSRFAFNLPEDPAALGTWTQDTCDWEVYEEVSSFGSDERRLLFSGRDLCRPDGQRSGAIVIRAMLDYDALSFISARSLPQLLRPVQAPVREGVVGRNVEFVVYGWSRRPIYTSNGRAWTLDDQAFARLTASRDPFWTTTVTADQDYDVYLLSDRAGIYAVGYPLVDALGHVINLAELTVLAAVLYLLILGAATLFSLTTGFGPASGRALLREIRASFYRKLFLAFVLASLVPVATLAFVLRAFIATQARSTLEAAAVRTAATAQRVIEDYSTLSLRDATGLPNLDDLMVGISRAIGQDVNVFDGPALWATSKRFLYESRLLPERTPSGVYRAIVLDRRSSFVDDESVDDLPYMVAAAPVRVGTRSAIVTVPLTLRQQETEREVDTLDRRILLAAVTFILLGAAIGYSMAERIADPVNRLTRATRRIARGDLDVRVVETSSDELRSLIAAFNSMAAELRHQQAELERSHRISAWAEMARQVAHEIKNPLTPIQLSAEHLARLHQDRGKPLTPVLEECVAVILTQVRLLRQIAAEFSAFASSPTAHPVPTSLADVIRDVVSPYRTGLGDRLRIVEAVAGDLPLVRLDRTLFQRALTNLIENALHAMPGGGTLTVSAEHLDGRVRLAVSDTGEGMDADALERVFEPYFSTKTGGTGLGLPIAKRNVELSGGTIAVESRKGAGTTVVIEMREERDGRA